MQDLTTFIFNHLYLSYSFAIVLILLFIVEYMRQKRRTFIIDTILAVQFINRQNAVVIDIRDGESFRSGHIIDSQSMTISDLKEQPPKKLEKFRIKPIIVVCHTGAESQKIAPLLIKQGYNVYSLSGGLRAWAEADLPLVKG